MSERAEHPGELEPPGTTGNTGNTGTPGSGDANANDRAKEAARQASRGGAGHAASGATDTVKDAGGGLLARLRGLLSRRRPRG